MAVNEELKDHSELTKAEMAAYEAEVGRSRQETIVRCKGQADCADRYGGRWKLFICPEDRSGKGIGRCLCDESRQNGEILSITIVSEE
jgi:hypothetical protein